MENRDIFYTKIYLEIYLEIRILREFYVVGANLARNLQNLFFILL